MAFKIDQKVWSTIGIAAAGALGALAASNTIDPKIAAFAGVAVIVLGSLGVHIVPVPQARQEAIIAGAAPPQTPPPAAAPPPPVKGNPYDMPWTGSP